MAKLLSDAEVQTFIRDGFIVLDCRDDFNPELHEKIADRSKEIFKDGRYKDGLGNGDIHKVIPEVPEVWSSPTVEGALRSLLGEDYVMHAHRHLHERLPGLDPEDQELHVDGTVGVTPVEKCQLEPWFVIAFYYPEKTTIDMGPTAVVSGTHLLEHAPIQCPGDADPVWRPVERKLVCEAGTVVLCDFRLVHKGCGNRSQKPRFMFKYNFFRTQVGAQPSWRHESPAWTLPPHPFLPKLSPVCLDIWNGFMLGAPGAPGAPTTQEALNLLLPLSAGAAAAIDVSEEAAPDAHMKLLVDLEVDQAVQARLHALAAAQNDTATAEALIHALVSTLLLGPSSRAAGLPIPGGAERHVPPAGIVGGHAPHLPTDTTARAVAIAIGKLASLAPAAAADAFGRMLQASTAVAHHAAMGLAFAAVRLQRIAQATAQATAADGGDYGATAGRTADTAGAFVRLAVLLLTSALGLQARRRADDQEVPQHGANGQPPLACALASALGHILSCVPPAAPAELAEAGRSWKAAERRIHLYTAAVGAVDAALGNGSVVDSDGALAMGRIGTAAAATADSMTALAEAIVTDAATETAAEKEAIQIKEVAASYVRLVRESTRALRRLDAGKAEGRPGVGLDYFGSELARRFADRWKEWGQAKPDWQAADAADAADMEAEAAATANMEALRGKTVELVNRARGAVLAISGACADDPELDASDSAHGTGLEGEQPMTKGLATLRAADRADAPADGTATHFMLEPTGDTEGSHYVVAVSSGRALHLHGLGDSLASVRYGDVRDTYSQFLFEAVPGDTNAFYLVNKQTRVPLHANGLGDQLISTRFGIMRDDWAQWAVRVV